MATPAKISKTNVTARAKGDLRPKSELLIEYIVGAKGQPRPRYTRVAINRGPAS